MKPNVILINCDDLGYGDIVPYGSEVNRTPYLSEIAKKGTVFTNAYCASSICTPSRAGLMTGCYPARLSLNRVLFPGEGFGLNTQEFTMPRLFKESGYTTKIIGKWHLGDQKEFFPNVFGFDDYYGLPYSNDMGRQYLNDTKICRNPPLPLIRGTEVIEAQPDQTSITERYTEEAVKFLRENKDNNFFLYMAHMHVHLPLYATKRFVDESENGDYGACVAETDWSCGVIMNELKSLGLEDNTIIIFTSDNGSLTRGYGGSNAPLNGHKSTSWEGGFRIPFMMVWKNHIKENAIDDNIISQMDLLPTFAKILDKPLSSNKIDGLDISKTLFCGEKVRDEFIYNVARVHSRECAGDSSIEAVRKGDYKLYFTRKKGADVQLEVKELYNLREDIGETTNIYDSNPEIVKELTSLFDKYAGELGSYDQSIVGSEVRENGKVHDPIPLTTYDPNHPYIISMYDKNDAG